MVPASFGVEVSSALVRRGIPRASVEAYVAQNLLRAEVVTLGPKRAVRIAALAMNAKLRAAVASYVWIASHYRLPPTDDNEVITHGAPHCAAHRLEPSGAWNPVR